VTTIASPKAVGRIVVLLVLATTLTSAAVAQPTFDKSFHPADIGPGSVSTLRFDITNADSFAVRNLAFSDNLPAGVIIATPAQATSTCVGGTIDAPDGGATITFSGGGIGAGTSCSITVDVTSSAPGTHTNVSGDLTSDAGNSGSATADLNVVTDRPGFSKSFSPASVSFGGRSTLTFTIDNSANASAATNLTFVDNLPTGMSVASPASASTDCGGGVLSAAAGSSLISLVSSFPGVASVGAGAVCHVTVDVVGGGVGTLANTTSELSSAPPVGSPVRSSGKAAATLTVTVDNLSLTKTFLDDPVAPGDDVTLEFTIRNLNRSSPATDLAFTDDLDAVLSGLVAVGLPLTDPCGAGSSLSGTSTLSLSGGSLAGGESCTFAITLQVPASSATGTYANTTSPVTGDVGGRSVSGNAASDLLFVRSMPLFTKTFLTNPVGAGDTTTVEFTIVNTSASPASDIAFTDNLDGFVTGLVVSGVPASGVCGPGSTLSATLIGGNLHLALTGGSLGGSASCTFDADLQLPLGLPAGPAVNTTSTLSLTLEGESLVGNPATDTLVIVGAPRLQKQFTDDPVAPGGTVNLQFTLDNGGEANGAATDIAFSDDLEATLSGLVATGLPLTDVCGAGSQIDGTSNLNFTGGSLATGESCTFSVTIQVPADALPGRYTNETSNVMATVDGLTVVSGTAAAQLQIAGLSLTKTFVDDPVVAGGSVTLEFSLQNSSATEEANSIAFTDNLNATLPGLVATGLPLSDVCGTGSSLNGASGNALLVFQGGSLAAGTSCTFSVDLQVPAGAASNFYVNTTSALTANIGGQGVVLDPATDQLTVSSDVLLLTKEFTNDPATPGGTVQLTFALTNLASDEATDIEFTDDLDATLSGLVALGLPLADPCGAGSQLDGTGLLTLTGGTLPAGSSCTFSVTLAVPSEVLSGTFATNVTSQVTGIVVGLPVSGDPASDVLRIDLLDFTKSFDGPVEAGDVVRLTFHIENSSQTEGVNGLSFGDDLDAVLPGLTAVGLPASDVCGAGSLLEGTSFLTLSDGSLLPGGSCTFGVFLQIPATAPVGSYLNVTTDLRQFGFSVGSPATATLTVFEVTDEDGDGVLDDEDVCPGTVIPEGVPTNGLGTNRYALVDGDGIFDTTHPNGHGHSEVFTIFDTAGCSCEQIIVGLDLGKGHVKFGCSIGAMREWIELVSP